MIGRASWRPANALAGGSKQGAKSSSSRRLSKAPTSTTSEAVMYRPDDVTIVHLNPAVPLPVEEARPPEFTDEALALRFAERHAHNLRYVAAWSRWLHWTGTRWQVDDTLLGRD